MTYEVSESMHADLSGPIARQALIGEIMPLAEDRLLDMSDAERLEAIRALLVAYRSHQWMFSGTEAFSANT